MPRGMRERERRAVKLDIPMLWGSHPWHLGGFTSNQRQRRLLAFQTSEISINSCQNWADDARNLSVCAGLQTTANFCVMGNGIRSVLQSL